MGNLEFSVPYNNDPETLSEIFRIKRAKRQSHKGDLSFRAPRNIPAQAESRPKWISANSRDVVDRIHREGIRVNLLLNSICEGSDWYSPEVLKSTMDYLRRAHEESRS